MLNINKIEVPTPYKAGPVNAYLIKNRPLTLIDPGPETAEALSSLQDGLSSLDVAVKDIERVVVTHYHSDHSGLAAWLTKEAQARVVIHKLEIRKLTPNYSYYQERFPFLIESGLPARELEEILQDVDPVVKPVLPPSFIDAAVGGEVLHFAGGGSLQVLHMPGHTSGHICLYNPVGRELFAGDSLLKHITPNPVMEADYPDFSRRNLALKQYLASLKRIANMDVRICLPGHGENIDDCRSLVERCLEHHRQRLAVLQNMLVRKKMNAYQLMRQLYPKIKGFQAFLGISEVFAHLDYLQETGRITRERQEGTAIYYRDVQESK
ncbi:MAG: MBL fold metallo-hydrolase [Peptococcaceae bacterium]|nr:MBL fold metallo-hydrolase [Candidatus Syntrophopropionicum ammoniitolerans]